jgi:hypothetical protein
VEWSGARENGRVAAFSPEASLSFISGLFSPWLVRDVLAMGLAASGVVRGFSLLSASFGGLYLIELGLFGAVKYTGL